MINQTIEQTLTEEESMVVNYYKELKLYCGHSKVNGELCLMLKRCGIISLPELIKTYKISNDNGLKVEKPVNKTETLYDRVKRWFKMK